MRRRKEIYEELYPETRKGISQARGMNESIGNVIPTNGTTSTPKTFVEDTISKTNVKKKSTIYDEMKISEKLDPEVKKKIKEVDLSKTEALKLARK